MPWHIRVNPTFLLNWDLPPYHPFPTASNRFSVLCPRGTSSCGLTWMFSPTHGHHQMVNTKIRLIIFFARRSPIQSAKIRLGDDGSSDPELLIGKFRLKLKKVGKTTRLFRYGLNQIPYDYTVEVTNRFKGLY